MDEVEHRVKYGWPVMFCALNCWVYEEIVVRCSWDAYVEIDDKHTLEDSVWIKNKSKAFRLVYIDDK